MSRKKQPMPPTMEEARSITAEARRVQRQDAQILPGPAGGAVEMFPDDPRDEMQRIRGTVVANGAQLTVPFTEADAKYAMDKEAFHEKALFDNWLYSKFDHTRPAEAARFNKLFPDYQKRMEAQIDHAAELMARDAKLKLRGIDGMEDAMFVWGVETGRIRVPETLTPKGLAPNADDPNAIFSRGLANPVTYVPLDASAPLGGYQGTYPYQKGVPDGYPAIENVPISKAAIKAGRFGGTLPYTDDGERTTWADAKGSDSARATGSERFWAPKPYATSTAPLYNFGSYAAGPPGNGAGNYTDARTAKAGFLGLGRP